MGWITSGLPQSQGSRETAPLADEPGSTAQQDREKAQQERGGPEQESQGREQEEPVQLWGALATANKAARQAQAPE